MARFSINLLAITLLGVEALASSAERFTGAVRVEQSLAERASFAGGWALAQTTCPTNAPVQCFKDNTGLNHSCCPSGTTCFENLNIPYCCPTNDDCTTEVQNFPICAGTGETMYQLGEDSSHTYFCCKEGQIGTIPISGYSGICREADSPPAASLLATKVAQYAPTSIDSSSTATDDGSAEATSTEDSGAGGSGTSTGTAAAAEATSAMSTSHSGSSSSPTSGSSPSSGSSSSSSASSSSSSPSSSSKPSSSSNLVCGAIARIAVGVAAMIGIILV